MLSDNNLFNLGFLLDYFWIRGVEVSQSLQHVVSASDRWVLVRFVDALNDGVIVWVSEKDNGHSSSIVLASISRNDNPVFLFEL